MRKYLLLFLLLLLHRQVFSQAEYEYCYWIDDRSDKRYYGTSETSHWHLQIDVAELDETLHHLHIQVKDTAGRWSSPRTGLFLRLPIATNLTARYWFDNGGVVETEVTNGVHSIDVSGLSHGLHFFHYQVKGSGGAYSPVRTSMFYNSKQGDIVRYDYWVNNDMENLQVKGAVPTDTLFRLTDTLDVASYPIRPEAFHFEVADGKPRIYGKNELHARFYNSNGAYVEDSAMYVDGGSCREVTGILPLQPDMPRTDDTPEADSIRWYQVETFADTDLKFIVSQACTVEVFSSEGTKLLRMSGEAVTDTFSCHAANEGTYYVALHSTAVTDMLTTISYTISYVRQFTIDYVVDGNLYAKDTVILGDSIVPMTEPVKKGYTFSGWSEIPETMPAQDITVTGSFTVNTYKVTYTVDGAVHATDSIAYGTALTAIAAPTKEGHTFSGWSEIPATMPASDVTVTGSFTVNTYKVTYTVDGAVHATDSVAFGTTLTAIAAPTKKGYTFSGWSEIPETMPAQDVTVTGSFSVNSYKITYTVDGTVHATDSVAFGTTLTAIAAPTKEGHTFSGWSEIPATMPASDVTVTGSFTVNTYKVTYTVDGEVHATDSVAYGTALTALAAPTKEGYTFSGWSEIPETMPANDVTVTGSFAIDTYKLTYMVDGAEYATDSIVYGTALMAMEAPVKEGYTFSGWSEIPRTMPANDVMVTGEFILNSVQTDNQGLVYELNQAGNAFVVSGCTDDLIDDVVIPSVLYELPVEAIKDKALMGTSEIKSVVIPESVNAVGTKVFYGCSSLLVVEWNATAPVRDECFDKAGNHGNMLVFVSNTATEVTYQGNVIIENTADRIMLTDGLPFRNTRTFTTRSISYSHDFTKHTKIGVSGGWEAMVLPFDVQTVTNEKKETLLPFGLVDFESSLPYWAAELQDDETFSLVQQIKANTPFIMQVPNSDEYEDRYNVAGEVTFSATNVTVLPTTDMEQEAGNGYVMLGSYEGTTADSRVYALNDEECTADGETYMAGSIFVANARDIRPFEAYVYTANAGRAPYLRVGNAGETGVGHSTFNVQHSTEIYDLTGRKVQNTETLKGGIYIINGKKVVIK